MATDYRLALTRTAAGLQGTWITPAGVGTPFPLVSPVSGEDAQEHRWYLEEYLRFPGPGDQARAREFERTLEGLGRALHGALKDPDGEPLKELMQAERPVLTISSDEADALALPFELLRDRRGPLVLRGLVLRRQLRDSSQRPVQATALPLRVLLVVARPSDVSFIDPRSSAGPMLEALETLGGRVRVDLCDPPTLAELTRRLEQANRRGQPYHLVHFDGHGQYHPATGVGALCFERPDYKNELVEGRRLGDLLTQMHIPVAVLEACQTADLSQQPVFGSVAPALLQCGVGSVVAFSHAVLVSAARILVQHLYQALCAGDSVGQALNAARRQLLANPERGSTRRGQRLTLQDWHIAQLYQAGVDPALVPGGAPAAGDGEPLQRGKAPEPTFGNEPIYGFAGRARELLELRRKLLAFSAVVVTGMGGMGKTSLAREAALWWHRTGLRCDGAAFFSFERRAGADRAIAAFGQYLEGPDFARLPAEEQRRRAVQHFRDKEVLWIWDNFESTLPQYQQHLHAGTEFAEEERQRLAALYRELTARGAKGWLVVTCRPDRTSLPGIAEMDLKGLAQADALVLALLILEKANVPVGSAGYEREAIIDLLDTLDHHPLSLELVLPHLRTLKPDAAAAELRSNLARFSNPDAAEERNRGLLASLAFSTDRLGPAARAVLPCLAWFDGGAFEDIILDFSGLSPEAWAPVRGELLGTALVEEDGDVLYGGRPYLKFHPTLHFAAAPEAASRGSDSAAERFLAVYLGLGRAVAQALGGSQPSGGMAVMSREEGNFRSAAALAFKRGMFQEGGEIAETVDRYLNRAGRTRERASFAAWAQKEMEGAARGPAAWRAERQHADNLAQTGKAREALQLLERQLREIDASPPGAAVERQRALCRWRLGSIWNDAGQPQLALAPLEQAIKALERLKEEGNLSGALGALTNALRNLGRLSEALDVAERGLVLSRERGDARGEAGGLARIAQILTLQHRHADAQGRYQEALKAAQRAGDAGREGTILQHLGSLADDHGDLAQAVQRYREALARFQSADDRAAEMRTYNLLGTVEQKLGHPTAAREWYQQAGVIAGELGAEQMLAMVAQNLGVLLQSEALALPEKPENQENRRRLLREAVALVAQCCEIMHRRGDVVNEAASLSQLGVLHWLLGELDTAEQHARQALAIHERLGLPDAYKDYAILEQIAAARGDAAQAERWRTKKEVKKAELARLARGEGS